MKFKEIYQSNVSAVRDALESLWCSDAKTPKQQAYAKQLKKIIASEAFASESYMPLVQSMDKYIQVDDDEFEQAMNLISKELWNKATKGKMFHPYKHQYESWKALLDPSCKSMVVTTGTGSGKTECFMLPLVRDLQKNPIISNQGERNIQAIFLYPLNALMEDQKERLQRLLEGTELTFAVYNGNLPESRNNDNKDAIDSEKNAYKNIVPTRGELRSKKADIILTNPTMLEYMLLRDKDQSMFTEGSLRWIVVDEAHTFTGAAATEIAMLLRRVVKAFGVDKDNLHFAASSATIGNKGDKSVQVQKLQKFISDISGVDVSKIVPVDGERELLLNSGDVELDRCRTLLHDNEYIYLNELFPDQTSIEVGLERLDALCDDGLRAKVHFFYRAPNNGIRVQLDDWEDMQNGILKLKTIVPTSGINTPYLEVRKCKHCGELFAVARINAADPTKYYADKDDENDLFNFSASGQSSETRCIFGVVDINATPHKGHEYVTINNDSITVNRNPSNNWCITENQDDECPHCGHALFNKGDERDNDYEETQDNLMLASSFRLSADYISRVLAPSLLDNMKDIAPSAPHKGQQYISFVDSRMTAAQSTFKQNLEVERFWAFSRVFSKLNKNTIIAKENAANKQRKESLEQQLEQAKSEMNYAEIGRLSCEIDDLETDDIDVTDYLTWENIYNLLSDDPDSNYICKQFVDQVQGVETDDNGDIDDLVKEHYIFAVMLENFSKYPPFAASAETMGVLTSYYPKLKGAKAPQDFIDFCQKYGYNDADYDTEWANLIKIYLDRVPRSNESIFMRSENHLSSDIMNCSTRFGLKKPARRTIRKPIILNQVASNIPIVQLLLAKIIDSNTNDLKSVLTSHKEEVNNVIEAMWEYMKDTLGLIEFSSKIKRTRINERNLQSQDWELDKDKDSDTIDPVLKYPDGEQVRFNVANLAFKLPTTVHMCRVKDGMQYHIRPCTTLFFGYAPYNISNNVEKPIESENWDTVFPSMEDANRIKGVSNIVTWAQSNRKIMFKHNLWGADGTFTNHLNKIYDYPVTFIQAEHTAQVNKDLSRKTQLLFKNHKINVLACSTTMEMGVDLGDLELVMMTSIPPHPANYKQRAGRSGRNEDTRSASLTLCSSDAVGLRVLTNPLQNLINRPVDVPFVDMESPAIIQRHANAFLMRESHVFFDGNSLSTEIVNCFTHFHFRKDPRNTATGRQVFFTNYMELEDSNNIAVYPTENQPMGCQDNTPYKNFAEWLLNYNNSTILSFLLDGTCLQGMERKIINNCFDEWEKRNSEIEDSLSCLGRLYEEEYVRVNPTKTQIGRLDTGYGRLLRWKYNEILRKKLLEYLSTHRFTPNADMPVDIIELSVYNEKHSNYKKQPENPSYPLRQALSQYSPGSVIVKENRVIKVAGVDFLGKENSKTPLKQFVSDGMDVVEDIHQSRVGNLMLWPVNLEDHLKMVQVKEFIPDINASDSRVLEKAPYTRVNAQLIGAERWVDSVGQSHLSQIRCNENDGNAKILYYNEGIGYGYCLCTNCGKMVLETAPCQGITNKHIPEDMLRYSITDENNLPLYGHYAIHKLDDKGKPLFCRPKKGEYQRNVILGDLIQTDYCEIRLRDDITTSWSASINNSIVVTLGLVLCRVFTEYIGKDRQSVDFARMPNGNLCIFDTNPGGSGYSNHLAEQGKMLSVYKLSYEMLNNTTCKEELLDKFTLQYINDIDIEATKEWLKKELSTWDNLPQGIANSYPDAKWTTFYNLVDDCKKAANSGNETIIFVNEEWNKWNYQVINQLDENEINTWKVRMLNVIKENLANSKVKVCIDGSSAVPMPIYSSLQGIKTWAEVEQTNDCNLPQGLYPLAIVNGNFYFTDEKETTNVDSMWARGNVFCIEDTAKPDYSTISIDVNKVPSNYAEFKINQSKNEFIMSQGLFNVVNKMSSEKGLDIEAFLSSCSKNNSTMIITYQDEHLKSAYGMVTTLQFIDEILSKSHKTDNFELRIVNERYNDYNGTNSHPFKGIVNDEVRNEVLKDFIDEWKEIVLNNQAAKCEIITEDARSLPHWRELRIECGDNILVIYPNGGIINEWFFDSYRTTLRYCHIDELSVLDNIPLKRFKPIKYEVIKEQ